MTIIHGWKMGWFAGNELFARNKTWINIGNVSRKTLRIARFKTHFMCILLHG